MKNTVAALLLLASASSQAVMVETMTASYASVAGKVSMTGVVEGPCDLCWTGRSAPTIADYGLHEVTQQQATEAYTRSLMDFGDAIYYYSKWEFTAIDLAFDFNLHMTGQCGLNSATGCNMQWALNGGELHEVTPHTLARMGYAVPIPASAWFFLSALGVLVVRRDKSEESASALL